MHSSAKALQCSREWGCRELRLGLYNICKDEGHIRTSPYRHTDTLALLVRDIVPWILLLGTRLEETEGLYCGEAVGDRK